MSTTSARTLAAEAACGRRKDQTYFLFGLTQEQLAQLCFRWAV